MSKFPLDALMPNDDDELQLLPILNESGTLRGFTTSYVPLEEAGKLILDDTAKLRGAVMIMATYFGAARTVRLVLETQSNEQAIYPEATPVAPSVRKVRVKETSQPRRKKKKVSIGGYRPKGAQYEFDDRNAKEITFGSTWKALNLRMISEYLVYAKVSKGNARHALRKLGINGLREPGSQAASDYYLEQAGAWMYGLAADMVCKNVATLLRAMDRKLTVFCEYDSKRYRLEFTPEMSLKPSYV